MKKAIFTLLLAIPVFAQAQMCNHQIPPHAVTGGVGSFHITADVTMPHNSGSNFYVCSGVHLTMEGSDGSNYYLEEGAMLTLLDHDGDNVFAKGNCTIVDQSTTTLAVTSESTTTISKPNDPFNYVQLTCATMVYDYSLVGGSAPCGTASLEHLESITEVAIFPNPVNSGEAVTFSHEMKSAKLIDPSGRVVFEQTGGVKEIRLDGIQTGIFLLSLEHENGQWSANRLVVK